MRLIISSDLSKQVEPSVVSDNEGYRGGLPEYGAAWAEMYPDDIVMLEEVTT